MDLKSGYPFWAVKNGLMYAFPQLESDITCDVLIVGAGITGALIARSLAAESLDVAIVEQRDIAWGSTAASTALLQYEIDTHMVDLAKQYGEKTAAAVYLACARAITALRDIMGGVRDVDFKMSQSLYIASSRRHESKMRSEFDMRRKHGLDVAWLGKGEVNDRFGIEAPCAILSSLAAQADPYRMASRLLHALGKRGVRIFDRTTLDRFESTSGSITAYTAAKCAFARSTSCSLPVMRRKSG